MIDLLSTTDDDLEQRVAEVLDTHARHEQVLAWCESGQPYDEGLWSALVELGVMPTEDELAQDGARWRRTAMLAEAVGAAAAGTPFLGTAMAVATGAAADRRAILALSTARRPDEAFPGTVRADNGRLTGEIMNVVDVAPVPWVLVPALEAGEPSLFLVERSAVRMAEVCSFDLTRPLSDLKIDGYPASAVATGRAAEEAVRRGRLAATVLLASEQIGIAQRCLDLLVAHLTSRHQFGQPLGAFQALKHRAADLWAAITQARAAERYAVGCLAAANDDLEVAASVAHAFCAEVARTAAEECLQLHGSLGYTWQHPTHLLLKRAQADALLFGSPADHRAHLATLVGLPPGRELSAR